MPHESLLNLTRYLKVQGRLMDSRQRKGIAALVLSTAALVGIMKMEGFTEEAVIPVKGDVPTIGYGSTKGVKLGDTITEPEARSRIKREVRDEFEAGIQRCAGDVLVTQGEYDSLTSLAYNVGFRKVCNSTMMQRFKQGRYAEGCEQIKHWTFYQGKNCRLPQYRRLCGGLVTRRDKEYAMCMGEAG